MRDHEKDSDEIYKRIEALELRNNTTSEEQRKYVPTKKRRVKKQPVVKDEDGTIIQICNWVKATTPGKFTHNEGRVEGWKRWVAFTDLSGVKQVCAPHNLLILNDVRKCSARKHSNSSGH